MLTNTAFVVAKWFVPLFDTGKPVGKVSHFLFRKAMNTETITRIGALDKTVCLHAEAKNKISKKLNWQM